MVQEKGVVTAEPCDGNMHVCARDSGVQSGWNRTSEEQSNKTLEG